MFHVVMAELRAGVYFGPIFNDAASALARLEAQLLELDEANKAIVNAADEADEDISDEDLATIEANKEKMAGLTAQISARKSTAPVGQGRKSTPDNKGGKPGTVPAAARDTRKHGFNSLGEFAKNVYDAHKNRDESAHNRLTNAHNEGTGEDGGFLVPPEFREGIMKVVEGENSLFALTDSSTTSRNAVFHAKDETTPWGTDGINVYWEGEAQSTTASQGKFKGDTLRLNKLFARVDASDEVLEDAPQLDNYLRVKAPEVMTSVLNRAIISGNGVGKPLGFMNSTALITVAKETSQPADTIHHRNIVKMWARMWAPCRANAVWLINQDVEPQLDLMSFRDVGSYPSTAAGTAVPVYLPSGTVAGQGYATLKGRPVIPVQGMATVGDLGDIALVDLKKYRTLTKSGGARVDTSIHLKFDTDETVFRFIFRVAGAPWLSAPIQPENGVNTLSPFVTLASR